MFKLKVIKKATEENKWQTPFFRDILGLKRNILAF